MRRLAVGIGLIMLSLLFVVQMVFANDNTANESYDDVYTQIEVDSEGTLSVNENITINMDKNQETYIKTLDISNASGIKDLSIAIINDEDDSIILTPSESLDELQEKQYYTETVYAERIKMNLYIPVKPYINAQNQLRIRLQYKATDLVSIYNDTAYFEWIVLANGKEALQNFVLDITYPQARNEEVKPLLNGPFYQREIDVDDWTTKIISTHIEPNELVTFSALMPATFCLDSRKIIDAEHLEEMSRIQNQIKIEQLENQSKYQTSRWLEKMLVGGPVVLILMSMLFLYIVYDRQIHNKESKHYEGKTPTQLTPAQLACQSGKRIGYKDVFSSLLYLCNKNIVQYKKNGEETVFVLNDIEAAQQLKRPERYLVNWIFNDNDTEEITAAHIVSVLDHDRKSHNNTRFKTWIRTVRKYTLKQVKGEPIIVARIIGTIMVLINVILSIVLTVQTGTIVWTSAVIASSLILFLYAYSLFSYNEQEMVCWLERKGLLRFLKSIKKQPNHVLTYNQWETLVPYAISLNKTKQVMAQMMEMFDQNQVDEKDAQIFKTKDEMVAILSTNKKIRKYNKSR